MGLPKLREPLFRQFSSDVKGPSVSTIHTVVDRHNMVKPCNGSRQWAQGTALFTVQNPNHLSCVDFKGEFKLGDGRYCYPLTITDHASSHVLTCEALESVREEKAFISRFH